MRCASDDDVGVGDVLCTMFWMNSEYWDDYAVWLR